MKLRNRERSNCSIFCVRKQDRSHKQDPKFAHLTSLYPESACPARSSPVFDVCDFYVQKHFYIGVAWNCYGYTPIYIVVGGALMIAVTNRSYKFSVPSEFLHYTPSRSSNY